MTPPRWAAWLARTVAPVDCRDAYLDDLAECCARIAVERGAREARRWYARQVLRGLPALVRLRRARLPRHQPREGSLAADLSLALRHGWRRLRNAPGFCASTVATLTFAFAGNLAVFTLVHDVLLAPLPYAHPESIVDVGFRTPGLATPTAGQSQGGWFLLRNQGRSFAALGIYNQNVVNLTGSEADAERVAISMVSHEVFDVLGVPPLFGRTYSRDDEKPGQPPTVILSYPLWHRRYGADAHIVGRRVVVNGLEREVIGVMPHGFAFPTPEVELWMGQGFDPREKRFGEMAYGSVGRLRPGVTPAQAEAEINAFIARLPELYTDARPDWLATSKLAGRVEPLQDTIVGEASTTLWIALGAAGLVLVLAGANVANLFLIRSEQRLHEIGICRALGASTRHILASVFSEALLTCTASGLLACLVAAAGLRALSADAGGNIPRAQEVAFGAASLAWIAALVLLTTVGLTLAAMWRTRQAGVRDAGRGASASRDRARARTVLCGLQVGLAFALLAGAALLVRSFWNLTHVPTGFDANQVLTLEIALPFKGYSGFDGSARFFASLLGRVRAVPGVTAAGAASDLPLSGYTVKRYLNGLVFVERPNDAPGEVNGVAWKLATPGYFETLRIPVLAGHWFQPGDHFDDTMPVAVSENFAKRHLGLQPLGRRIHHYADPRWCTVVGIVGNVRDDDLKGEPAEAVYLPVLDQKTANPFTPSWMGVAIRSALPPDAIAGDVRRIVREIDPNAPVAELQMMDRLIDRNRARDTLILSLVGGAAGLAVLVGMVGLYGAIGYAIAQRRRELGIRVALGATPGQLRASVARGAAATVGAGLLGGAAAAWTASGLLRRVLFDVDAHDAPTFLAAAVALALVATLALGLSVRRLRMISPLEALRSE